MREGPVKPWSDELKALGSTRRQRMYGREVILSCDDVPLVLARSVLPERVSRLAWRAVRSLGSRPLAELLFATARVRRSTFEFLRFGPGDMQTRWAHQQWARQSGMPWPTRSMWCRRSCFFLRNVPMLVMECFAPAVVRPRTTADVMPTTPPVPASRCRAEPPRKTPLGADHKVSIPIASSP